MTLATTDTKAVRKPAWEEELFSRTPETVQEALEMADLDWEVVSKTLAWLVKGQKGEADIARTIQGWQAYIKSDTQEVIHIAKDHPRSRYKFYNNEMSFSFVDELIQRGHRVVAGGNFSGPHRSWLLLELDDKLEVGGDLIQPHVAVINFHDEKSLQAYYIPLRVLSQTLLTWPLKAPRTRVLKHESPDNTDSLLAGAEAYWEKFKRCGDQLAEAEMNADQMEELAQEMFVVDSNTGPRARQFRESARLRVLNLFRFGKTRGNSPETAWAAANVLTEYDDWYRPNLRVSRFQRALDDIDDVRQKVLAIVIDKAEVS